MEICTYTEFSDDAKKLLLHLLRRIKLGIENGMIHDAVTLGIAASHIREIASELDAHASYYFNAFQETPPTSDNDLNTFLQSVPKSWPENPWPLIFFVYGRKTPESLSSYVDSISEPEPKAE
jgi:hypothetical protein